MKRIYEAMKETINDFYSPYTPNAKTILERECTKFFNRGKITEKQYIELIRIVKEKEANRLRKKDKFFSNLKPDK